MASCSFYHCYDPEEMAWSTISHGGNQASASAERIRNENLFRLLERRSQRRKAKMLAAAAEEAPEYLGAQLAADLSFVLSRELKLIVASTKNSYAADRLLGDFVINTAKGDVSLHGHLKESDEQVCHGVVTIANSQTAESLKDSIQWRQGTILYIRKFGTSNKARRTFAWNGKQWTVNYNSEIITLRPYFRKIPAGGVYGTVGHNANTCRSPSQDHCGLCRQQEPFVEGMWAPHECAVRGGVHATNSKACAAKYRKDTKMAAPKGAKNNTARKPPTPQPTHVTGGNDSPRQDDVNSPPARPSGLA
ncbi:hypothetical protein HPB50_025267 [Hyalomma asiaticum]|uniref:Uncharacterized protein n=1 Tax=Hyalomma asiaticum TaxID=266040 RepID=A0ACB7RYV8_HYAAI|nr:hypothetical protein HPB50_025267 [Hyalomma asiaticum]